MPSVATQPQADFSREALTFPPIAFEPGKYIVKCFPARESDGVIRDWSLSQLEESDFQMRLQGVLPHERRRRRQFYAPTVKAMSGVYLQPELFTALYPLNNWCTIRRPAFRSRSPEMVKCDATSIPPHQGMIMSAGGCPLVVMNGKTPAGEEFCFAAHAGRASLIDDRLFTEGLPSRAHFSVIDALVAQAEALGVLPKDLILRSFFSIPWFRLMHEFSDPKFGKLNLARYAYLKSMHALDGVFIAQEDRRLCLSLSGLIQRQAQRHGIVRIESGLLELPEDGDYAYTRHVDPELAGTTRNLVMVMRI
ncbi:MAG: hypothetical protein JWL75_766 [Parcubacteria group bacterium]|nr:hypothetical protein [Parcubacteria group bacterium]